MPRNYRQEYDRYHSRPEQRRNRASRNKARRLMIKKHGRQALENQDIDHVDGDPTNNSMQNLKITTKKYNRSKR
jgi:hypothetical protein